MPEQTNEISAVLAHSYATYTVGQSRRERLYTRTFARQRTCWQRDESQVIQHSCCGGLGESCAVLGSLSAVLLAGSQRWSQKDRNAKPVSTNLLVHALTYAREKSTTKSNTTRDVEKRFRLSHETNDIATIITCLKQYALENRYETFSIKHPTCSLRKRVE